MEIIFVVFLSCNKNTEKNLYIKNKSKYAKLDKLFFEFGNDLTECSHIFFTHSEDFWLDWILF